MLVWRERSRKAGALFLCAGIHVNVYEYASRRWGVYLKYSSHVHHLKWELLVKLTKLTTNQLVIPSSPLDWPWRDLPVPETSSPPTWDVYCPSLHLLKQAVLTLLEGRAGLDLGEQVSRIFCPQYLPEVDLVRLSELLHPSHSQVNVFLPTYCGGVVDEAKQTTCQARHTASA